MCNRSLRRARQEPGEQIRQEILRPASRGGGSGGERGWVFCVQEGRGVGGGGLFTYVGQPLACHRFLHIDVVLKENLNWHGGCLLHFLFSSIAIE